MIAFSFLTSKLGRWALGIVAVLLIGGAIYGKGYSDGKAKIQAKWDAAVSAAIERGVKARTDAEHAVDSNGNAAGVSNDIFDRDRGAM